MTIQAVQTSQSTCPPGCAGHLDGQVHISTERVVQATAYAGEHSEMYVSRELDDRLGVPAVQLSGVGDAPMTPAQALELAAALTVEALAALTGWGPAR